MVAVQIPVGIVKCSTLCCHRLHAVKLHEFPFIYGYCLGKKYFALQKIAQITCLSSEIASFEVS